MAEQDLSDLFIDLDADVRKLLSLIHIIEVNRMLQKDDKKKIEEALFLLQKIYAELYLLVEK